MRSNSSPTSNKTTPGRSPAGRSSTHLAHKPKITDKIVAAVREEIVSGTLSSGAQLPTEKELAKRFSVSQPTIREVMRVLDSMGLIEVHHGSGTYVSRDMGYGAAIALQNLLQLQRLHIIQVFDVRAILGRESASRAAELATSADLSNIEAALNELDEISKADSLEDVISRIITFQEAISVAAHNPLLHSLESFLINLLLMVQSEAIGKRGVKYWQKRSLNFKVYRTAVVTAIVKRNAKAASNAMIKYLNFDRDNFLNDGELRTLKVTDPLALLVASQIVLKKRKGS
ncbi:GntR family transcriptional regulator [Bradyrhizobium sp. 187]|uniref:FadR/GntR family transcriptional regulator n=1 Tax=Bradyrhizobium sp. 187 TaxID=2782655 RepID=UPI001FFFE4CA|nr:GntR family transcriptional regulator [Bradyrhizobium sp. 187]UPJ71888.1 FadR family transcriptional regulator [Bradyrhizobium sp. 187]